MVWYTLLRARDLPVLAKDALDVDTRVLAVDLVVLGAEVLAMDADLLTCRHAGDAQGVGTGVGISLHLHQFSILQRGIAAQHLHSCVVNSGCPQWTWAGTLTEMSCWTACGSC